MSAGRFDGLLGAGRLGGTLGRADGVARELAKWAYFCGWTAAGLVAEIRAAGLDGERGRMAQNAILAALCD